MKILLIVFIMIYIPTKNIKNNFTACKKKIVKCRVG